MSYEVLARKWRPRRFEEMVGQEHVLRALANALDSGRLHHALLFTGTRGVGKTTLARIFAKSLNCEQGVSASPCGQCQTCQEIDAGRFVDLIEVDAASRTKVEDTRELLDNVQYAPTVGRYKVYLVDEVHMLSNHSFNALLKTLEEPPPHVKFLLATTDPQKVPVTILSRCLQFNLRRLHPDMIADYLQKLLTEEEITAESSALMAIAKAADGSMRDALSLLDQAIAFSAGNVNIQDVQQMLGAIEHKHLYHILSALAQRNAAALFEVVKNLHTMAPDYTNVLAELLSVLHYIALLQQLPEAYDDSMGDQTLLSQLAGELAAEDIQLFYQIGLTGQRDLIYAPDPAIGFEMTLLRMLAFCPAEPGEAKMTTPSANTVTKPTPSAPKQMDAAVSSVQTATAPPAQTSPALNETPKVESNNGEVNWSRLVAALKESGVVKQLAMNCSLTAVEGMTLVLALEPSYENLATNERKARLESAIQAVADKPYKLDIQIKQVAVETPAMQQRRMEQEKLDAAQQALESDTNVQKIIDTFDAKINPNTIQPID